MFGKQKIKLSDKNAKILMIEIQKIIEDVAEKTADDIINGNISNSIIYPPNGGFGKIESAQLNDFSVSNKNFKGILRKIIADSSALTVFELFNLIDGTSDPELSEWENFGISLVDSSDNIEPSNEMLHDQVFEAYWEWKKIRNKDWKLDILEE